MSDFQEYPKWLHKDGESVLVADAAEEKAHGKGRKAAPSAPAAEEAE